MTDLVYVVAQVEARLGCEDALRSALLKLVAVSEAETGFIRYDLHEDIASPGHFTFYEIWSDQASLDLHNATPQMAAHVELTKDWVTSVSVRIFRKING